MWYWCHGLRIAYALKNEDSPLQELPIRAKGGLLKVRFEKTNSGFANIWLCGPAEKVFKEALCFK